MATRGIDYRQFGRDEWTQLKKAGLQMFLKDGKTPRLDATALTSKLAAYVVDKATVATVDELQAKGVTLNELMQKVCNLPVTTKDVVQEDVKIVIKGQLGGTVNGKVQGQLDGAINVWLITAKVTRLLVDSSTGLEQQSTEQVWAVTSDPALITTYSVLPGHKRVTAYEVGNLRNSMELVRRVPELGAQLVAVHRQREIAVALASTKVLDTATARMSEIERRDFDAQVEHLMTRLEADPALAKKMLAIESA